MAINHTIISFLNIFVTFQSSRYMLLQPFESLYFAIDNIEDIKFGIILSYVNEMTNIYQMYLYVLYSFKVADVKYKYILFEENAQYRCMMS